jgi:NAD-dependent deacetylase
MDEALRAWVRSARRIAVLSGAGMSAESGVPTFRDALTGLWARFDPHELATEEAFRCRPELVWDWYAERRSALQRVQPNAGHTAIAEFQRRHPGRLTLITQNVDGLHQRAGSPGVLALHGDLMQDRWLQAPRACCREDRIEAGRPPRCPVCGNLRRPGVVWFGEALPETALAQAQAAAEDCDLMLVVGTSGEVYPAAGLAGLARRRGARVLIVNPQPSALDSEAARCLRETAAVALPWLLGEG